MVSNAKDDLPDPLRPVMTVSASLGISRVMFFRLCCLAPLIRILLLVIALSNLHVKHLEAADI